MFGLFWTSCFVPFMRLPVPFSVVHCIMFFPDYSFENLLAFLTNNSSKGTSDILYQGCQKFQCKMNK